MDVADSWSSFIEVLSKDKRIGESHMEVPGHDGRKGFGALASQKIAWHLLSMLKKIILI